MSHRYSRRSLLKCTLAAAGLCMLPTPWAPAQVELDPVLAKDWLARWEKGILSDAKNRYCDEETGEELGWLVSPFINGFYYGYLATGETKWIDLLIDWTDAWIKRGVKEPDGFIGWPKADGASTGAVPNLFTDNILGEAMALRPAVLMAHVILTTPTLKEKYQAKAQSYLDVSEQVYKKWDSRDCWRETKEGGVWVVPTFGIDEKTNQWTKSYEQRKTDGFSLPPNKQNLVAEWLLAMYDATAKPQYRERAEKWWRVMKSRMRLRDEKYYVWNYWEPAGPWDYKPDPDGQPKHWVGVHPNGGSYDVDVDGITTAYAHKLVFEKQELDRLIATNRDFMWDQHVKGAKFKRIDDGKPEGQWKNSPGVLWFGLLPYDESLRKVFEANHDPASWGGLAATPRYLALARSTQ